jgi:large subunit ribosomal protein L18
MDKTQYKNEKRAARHKRIRARVIGTAERPRLAIFRSNRFIYAQLIDDTAHKTIGAVDSRAVTGATPLERASAVGAEVAKKAKALGIAAVVFDRGGFRYQGNVAAVADAARAGGLQF